MARPRPGENATIAAIAAIAAIGVSDHRVRSMLMAVQAIGWHPGWDGHLLLLYSDESQRRSGVSAWVHRGLELGSKVLYTEPHDEPPGRALTELLRHEPGALEAMDRGQIEIVPADGESYDSAFLETAVDRALSEGYPSVRWSWDAATTWRALPQRPHDLVEQVTAELCTSRALSAMCQYAALDSLEAVGLLSQGHGAGLREQLFQAAPVAGGLALAGEVDTSNQEILRSLLVTATTGRRSPTFVLDLSQLGFLDLPGARALLLGTLGFRSRGGCVRLQAPQPHVGHLISLLGIDRTPGIEVVPR